jgi:uncharacterized protein (DUF1330 family)
MSAFYIARVKVKDEVKLQSYSSKAMEIFSGFQGELLSKGQLQKSANQSQNHDFAVVMQFPTLEKLNQAINSDAYQAILPIRHAGADVNISIYQ